MKRIYVVGTCDTKEHELQFVKAAVKSAGQAAVLVDVSTVGQGGGVDVSSAEVAEHASGGRHAVLGLNDRGAAVAAMGEALGRYLLTRDDIGGVIGLGGGGNTALVTQAMRALPIGVPKLMVSTIASGDVSPYVGACDICMMYSVTDIAGINSINRVVLGNAAQAIAGMARDRIATDQSAKPSLGLTQFGVTTACADRVRAALESDYECMVFHATGTGGQTMEKLTDNGFLCGQIDLTTTEVADYLIGGVLACTDDRFGAIARTRRPSVISCGALDMVNFGPRDTVPVRFANRHFYQHNAYVTLMRTTAEENEQIGAWIAGRLNQCDGEVRLLIPEAGVSALDSPGMPFHDPRADRALFDALEKNLQQTATRRIAYTPFHLNDPQFARELVATFLAICEPGSAGKSSSVFF
jgi:uncharacterized protein (UPF0261 family)